MLAYYYTKKQLANKEIRALLVDSHVGSHVDSDVGSHVDSDVGSHVDSHVDSHEISLCSDTAIRTLKSLLEELKLIAAHQQIDTVTAVNLAECYLEVKKNQAVNDVITQTNQEKMRLALATIYYLGTESIAKDFYKAYQYLDEVEKSRGNLTKPIYNAFATVTLLRSGVSKLNKAIIALDVLSHHDTVEQAAHCLVIIALVIYNLRILLDVLIVLNHVIEAPADHGWSAFKAALTKDNRQYRLANNSLWLGIYITGLELAAKNTAHVTQIMAVTQGIGYVLTFVIFALQMEMQVAQKNKMLAALKNSSGCEAMKAKIEADIRLIKRRSLDDLKLFYLTAFGMILATCPALLPITIPLAIYLSIRFHDVLSPNEKALLCCCLVVSLLLVVPGVNVGAAFLVVSGLLIAAIAKFVMAYNKAQQIKPANKKIEPSKIIPQAANLPSHQSKTM